jgi:hypothetical protein
MPYQYKCEFWIKVHFNMCLSSLLIFT